MIQLHSVYTDYKELLHETYYRQTSNISSTLVGNKIVDHSNVVGASHVDPSPTTHKF